MQPKMLTIISSAVIGIQTKEISCLEKTRTFHPLSVEASLFGKSGLSDNDNVILYFSMN